MKPKIGAKIADQRVSDRNRVLPFHAHFTQQIRIHFCAMYFRNVLKTQIKLSSVVETFTLHTVVAKTFCSGKSENPYHHILCI